MAAEVVTVASVIPGTGIQYEDHIAGATITAGQWVYLDTSDSSKAKLADANSSSATATVRGVAMHGALSGQPLRIAVRGNINPGFTVGIGDFYILHGDAGGISLHTDLATGYYPVLLGIGTTASNLLLGITAGGVAKD